MNQYKTSQALFQLDPFSSLSSQAMQASLFRLSPSKSGLDNLNQLKTVNSRDALSFDALAEPTKKIKNNQQSLPKMISSAQSLKPANLPKNLGDLTMKDTLPKMSFEESRQGTPSFPFGADLIIPGLNNLSQGVSQMLPFQAYQMMLQQQLQQRKTQYYMQQQMLMHLARQQMQSGDLDYSKFTTQQTQQLIDPKIAQSDQSMTRKDEVHKSESVSTKIDSEEENNYQYIKTKSPREMDFKASEEETTHTKSVKKPELKYKAPVKRKTQGSKRNNNDKYWSEYSEILENNLYRKTKEEPRSKNKWQSQHGDDTLSEIGSISPKKEEKRVVETVTEQKQPKTTKPMDIPQHMQDDSKIDYENLISMTITNDPASVGTTEGSTVQFVMINKNTNPSIIQPHDTRVGDRYQVSVPAYQQPVAGKRRSPKITWKPDIVKENDLKAYFTQLSLIFDGKEINQEQALRLLKSKKYKKDKVVVNIGKSRKYYTKVLTAPEADKDVLNDH